MDHVQAKAGVDRLARELPLTELMQYWRDLVERWRVLVEHSRSPVGTRADLKAAEEAWTAAEVAWRRYEATKALIERVMGVEPMGG